ncbi:MAG: thioredoxin-dependent thiol peroxidase [Bacteroidetes bacterium]|nr:thioredoxin-dependent thiol peroxidase [Bacteroidota bacterium]
MLKVGDKAPAFDLTSGDGVRVRLSDLKGSTVILYFYPKDDTSGCTKEACAFQESFFNLKKRGVVIVGVSADSVGSHAKFAAKHGLTFPLLSDPDKKAIKAYGVWKKKSMYGRSYLGIERTTFVIDPKGTIHAIFPKVKLTGHIEEVLAVL